MPVTLNTRERLTIGVALHDLAEGQRDDQALTLEAICLFRDLGLFREAVKRGWTRWAVPVPHVALPAGDDAPALELPDAALTLLDSRQRAVLSLALVKLGAARGGEFAEEAAALAEKLGLWGGHAAAEPAAAAAG